jgi:hypothetical protein
MPCDFRVFSVTWPTPQILPTGSGDDYEAVGLLQIGRQLGQELVGCNPDGGGQVRLFQDRLLDGPADRLRSAEEIDAVGDVEKSLIERDGLHERRVFLEDCADGVRDFRVAAHSDGQQDGVGTAPHRLARRHGAVDTELAGLVGCGAHHAPASRVAAHDDGFAFELRVVVLLHRSVKGVHIDVNDLTGLAHDFTGIPPFPYDCTKVQASWITRLPGV